MWNLHIKTTIEDLNTTFSVYGTIVAAKVYKQQSKTAESTYGWVQFRERKSLFAALELKSARIRGSRIFVRAYRPVSPSENTLETVGDSPIYKFPFFNEEIHFSAWQVGDVTYLLAAPSMIRKHVVEFNLTKINFN